MKRVRARSLRVRVVRPMANGHPIPSREARLLLRAVTEYRPFACATLETEMAAWEKVNDTIIAGDHDGVGDAEDRFWYLLDVYNRHRMHGYALAGLSKVAIEMLEKIVLCIDTYGYKRRHSAVKSEPLPVTLDISDAERSTGTCISSEPRLLLLEPTQESSPEDTNTEDAIDRALRGLSEMKALLTEAQRERHDKEIQLAVLSETNERLQCDNQELRSQIASLHTQLSQAQRHADTLDQENDPRDDAAARRAQCLCALMQSLVAMLDATEVDGRADQSSQQD